MTLDPGAFWAVWAFLAMNVLSPGPNVVNTISTAMGSGRSAGLASALGVGLGIGGWCLAMTLGMAGLFRLFPYLQTVLTLVGILLLLWFAVRHATRARQDWQSGARQLAQRSGLGERAAFLRSLGVNATNPKALTTWVAVLSLFPVAIARPGDIAVLSAGAAITAGSIHAVYAMLFSSAPAARFYLKAAPAVNAAVSVFFAGFAAKLAIGLSA
ncbi:LysE family translocator [Defluviimonas sp. WL0002]|uniref:LysE family translocator n=1 Tax=Albidovulum marisflavi TaxID=2984159 RepID=A0ABT2Z7N7_9RHOB|nr:LysE family translocator [Defluviimonas sp. WL0002]MCV2867111.1 LysE family translocator [Defluviimonas sp. WL0002]